MHCPFDLLKTNSEAISPDRILESSPSVLNLSPIYQSQKCEQAYAVKCGLGASVGCRACKRASNTPRLKSHLAACACSHFVCFTKRSVHFTLLGKGINRSIFFHKTGNSLDFFLYIVNGTI